MPPFEVVGDVHSRGPFVFTCEHASNSLPDGLIGSRTDAGLLADHWGWDIGAAEVARGLVAQLGGQAVLGGVSRLVVDLNRDPRSPDLVLRAADGVAIDLNLDIDDVEIERRHANYFAPFHDAVDRTIRRRLVDTPDLFLISIHSFTPVFAGCARSLDVGVLFDDHEREAMALAAAISSRELDCRLNEPYTGKPPDGLIYSVARHGRAHGVRCLEVEIRQDLIAEVDGATAIASKLAEALIVMLG